MSDVRMVRAGLTVAVVAALLPAAAVGASGSDECGLPPGAEPCPEWTARYQGELGTGNGSATAVAVSPEGSTVFVGGDVGPGGQDLTVIAYDAATGAQGWVTEHEEAGDDALSDLEVSPGGDTVFATGSVTGGADADILTFALDALDGETLWTARLDGGGSEDHPWALTVSPGGERIYVTGYTDQGPSAGNRNFVTVAYGSATGQELWRGAYDGPARSREVARDVGVATYRDEEGDLHERVFVTGRSGGATAEAAENDYATVAYDGETGEELWVARYDGPAAGRDYPVGLEVSPDQGTVYVSGESLIAGTRHAYATIAYDAATGQQVWVSRYDRGDVHLQVEGVTQVPRTETTQTGDIAVSPSGDRLYVTGESYPTGTAYHRRRVTFALDAASGAEVWSAVGDDELSESGTHVVASPDGENVLIAGQVSGWASGDIGCPVGFYDPTLDMSGCTNVSGFLAVSLDAETGTERWVARHGIVASDALHAATALSVDGSRLFLAGREFSDFRALAYAI